MHKNRISVANAPVSRVGVWTIFPCLRGRERVDVYRDVSRIGRLLRRHVKPVGIHGNASVDEKILALVCVIATSVCFTKMDMTYTMRAGSS